jgi:acylpyruvate hydrolase
MKIICIGLNYKGVLEESGIATPIYPVFFLKPDTALVTRRHVFYYPDFSSEINYEIELVLRICKVGRHIQKRFAHTYYDAVGVGIDFTAMDLLSHCRNSGYPWEISKAFDFSAPVSQHFIPINEIVNLKSIDFHLDINGITCQSGNSSEMLFGFDEIIAYVSQFITLKMGDLIFTGTPKGTGKIQKGDRLDAYFGDRKLLSVAVK